MRSYGFVRGAISNGRPYRVNLVPPRPRISPSCSGRALMGVILQQTFAINCGHPPQGRTKGNGKMPGDREPRFAVRFTTDFYNIRGRDSMVSASSQNLPFMNGFTGRTSPKFTFLRYPTSPRFCQDGRSALLHQPVLPAHFEAGRTLQLPSPDKWTLLSLSRRFQP